jgi:hypothetical protein
MLFCPDFAEKHSASVQVPSSRPVSVKVTALYLALTEIFSIYLTALFCESGGKWDVLHLCVWYEYTWQIDILSHVYVGNTLRRKIKHCIMHSSIRQRRDVCFLRSMLCLLKRHKVIYWLFEVICTRSSIRFSALKLQVRRNWTDFDNIWYLIIRIKFVDLIWVLPIIIPFNLESQTQLVFFQNKKKRFVKIVIWPKYSRRSYFKPYLKYCIS